MIPISDDNPGRHPPFMTWAIVGLCVLVFLWQITVPSATQEATLLRYAFVPERLFHSGMRVPVLLTLVTALFLHGGPLHLGGNMLYLWIFGNNIEDAMGHARFVVFYFVCGIAASLSHGLVDETSTVPVIGASGAISGVLAAYALIFPRARVTVIVPLGIILYPMKISALFVIGFWFVMQLVSAVFTNPGQPGVAWWAHVGGFAAGLVLTPILSRYPLFMQHRRGPWD